MLSNLSKVATKASTRTLCSQTFRAILQSSKSTTPLFTLQQQQQQRFFSQDSHDDFAPKRKEIKNNDEAHEIIHSHVQNNKIMLYMKGNPSMPMCGFSARVVQVLKDEGVDFSSVNVLDYPEIREGVKKYSQWPTIPQLYVDGEFVGGCDIVTSMHESGELAELVKDAKK
jgi:monothiol glutaredoxin